MIVQIKWEWSLVWVMFDNHKSQCDKVLSVLSGETNNEESIHSHYKVILGCYVYSDPFSRTEFLFGEHDVINHNWNFINMITFTFTYLLSVFHVTENVSTRDV